MKRTVWYGILACRLTAADPFSSVFTRWAKGYREAKPLRPPEFWFPILTFPTKVNFCERHGASSRAFGESLTSLAECESHSLNSAFTNHRPRISTGMELASASESHAPGTHAPGTDSPGTDSPISTVKSSFIELLRVAAPLMVSSGSLSLMQVVDRIFLTRLSVDALAASMPAGMLHWTALSLPMGLGVACRGWAGERGCWG